MNPCWVHDSSQLMMYNLRTNHETTGRNRHPWGLDAEHAAHAKQDLVPAVMGQPLGNED